MNNLEKLEAGIAGLKVIKFRAVLGKTQGKLNVCPARSKTTKRLLGVKLMSEEEKRTASYVIDENTDLDIFDGFEIDLDNPIDAMNWEWLKYLPELVPSLEDSYDTPLALFYVENLHKDTNDRIAKRKVKELAFKYLDQSNAPKKAEICRIMGVDSTYMTPLDLEDYLGEMADTAPSKIVEAFEDKLIKVKLFLYALLDKKIVVKDQDGVYSWGAHILGVNEKSVLEWLQISSNAHYVKSLHDQVYPAPEAKEVPVNTGELALPPKPVIPVEKTESPILDPVKAVPTGDELVTTTTVIDMSLGDEMVEQLARQKYEELFFKKAGNMSLKNILAKIEEEETREM
jgi:hypothetical protein